VVEIGVLEDDRRRLAAELSVTGISLSGGEAASAGRRRAAGERHLLHQRMLRSLADHRAFARHDAHDAFRHAACSQMRPSSRAASGVTSAGFTTTAFRRRAGASFCASLAIGEFHGVIAAITPSARARSS
jgi:hypothetical protein